MTKEEFIQEFHAIFGHKFENNLEVMWNWIQQYAEQEVRRERGKIDTVLRVVEKTLVMYLGNKGAKEAMELIAGTLLSLSKDKREDK